MTEGESHTFLQSLVHTACGYEAWRQLNIHAAEMIKHYTQWLQTIQEYETAHKTRINDDMKIASVVNSVRGQPRNHLLLNIDKGKPYQIL
eukprot:2074610-Amphidinium_carterae.1